MHYRQFSISSLHGLHADTDGDITDKYVKELQERHTFYAEQVTQLGPHGKHCLFVGCR